MKATDSFRDYNLFGISILFTNAEICIVYTWEIPEAYFFVNMRMYFTSMQQNCDDLSLSKFDMYT